jgi:GH24 family phage-related lysozyme (muramidase)
LENVHSSTWTARILQEHIEECTKIELKTITWTASGAIVPPPERQEVKQEQNVTKADTFWQAYEIAIPLIQKYEWLSLKAYPDPVRCTIWWWTVANHCWEAITQQEADIRLAGIVKQVTERVQDDFPKLTPRQQAWLISFAFNCEAWYRDVAKRWLDKHKYWCNTANGKTLQWLVNRRAEERQYIFE